MDYETQRKKDEAEATRRKDQVGMADYGTREYAENARYVLRSYTNPSRETQNKLDSLDSILDDD